MVSSGEVDDLENQRRVHFEAIDRGGGWVTSLWKAILSSFHSQHSPADDESEERELTRITHHAPASPHVSENLSSVSTEDDSTITGTALVSDQVNLNIEDDITTRIANEAKIQYAKISKIVKEKDLVTLQRFGGIKGIADALDTDLDNGIPGDDQDLHDRRSAVGSTTLAPTPSFFKLLLKTCRGPDILLLLVCASLSTVFGIKEEGIGNGWLEGAVGMFLINIIVLVRTMLKYLSVLHPRITSQMKVKVRRGGKKLHVSPSDVVPGDILCLAVGSIVPADGLFVSAAAGRSLELKDGMESPIVDDSNPFLVHGATVVNGNGRMLVTSVGMKTTLGWLMSQVRSTPNRYHLLSQLDKFSIWLQRAGLLVTISMLLVLIIRSQALGDNEYPGFQSDQLKGKATASKDVINAIGRLFKESRGQIRVFAVSMPILIVGLSEVPLSVALAIAYWSKTTLSKKAIFKEMLDCFTMRSVSTICIGAGGLSLNPVLDVHVSQGVDQIIGTESVAGISRDVREALYKGISAPLFMPSSSREQQRLLLTGVKSSLGLDSENLLQNCTIVGSRKSSTDEEASGVLIKDSEAGDMCYWSGPVTTILPMSNSYYDSKGAIMLMDEQKKHDFTEIKGNMESNHLMTVAFAYKKIDALMPEEEEDRLILIGILGVKCCTETMEALEVLRTAGVNIIQFPEENESALSEDETAIYGGGRPIDKLYTVKRLKDEGHVVVMVGARTNETPALKEADLGIATGSCISEMAREGSDLIIPDGSLSDLVTIIRTGRCIHYNIQKYIQVELTMNISVLVTISVTTMFLGHCTLGPIQVLWAHMLVRTLCGLAVLLEPPTKEQMGKPPVKQTKPLISNAMWRNILLQALYQAAVLVTMQFKFKALLAILGIRKKTMESIVFSSYVLCQVFNQVNSREPEKKNVFRGIRQSPWLWGAVGVSITMQMAFVETAHKVAGNARLNWAQWGVCILIAIVSWSIDLAGKCAWDVIMKILILDPPV